MTNYTRAVIWDMDGTLIDSTKHHWNSWRETLAKEDYELDHDEFKASFGQRNDAILRGFFGEDLSDSEVDRIADAKEERYRELVRSDGIELLPGVQQWLDRCRDAGWQQAIGTSAPRANVEAIIDVLGITDYFATIVSAEDAEHGKPDPQTVLIAAERLGVDTSRCIVVEDSPAGTEGAERAGMHSVGVRTSKPNIEADVVVDDLSQLDADAFDKLVGEA